ncbi:MAG: hypothetical protein ACRCW9_09805 [Cetobacterium sp.]
MIDLNFSGDVQSDIQNKLIEWSEGKAYGSATIRSMGKDYIKQNILSKYPNIVTSLLQEKDDEGNQFDFNYLAESMEGMFDSFGKHTNLRA